MMSGVSNVECTLENRNILLRGELQPEYREGEGVEQQATAKILVFIFLMRSSILRAFRYVCDNLTIRISICTIDDNGK